MIRRNICARAALLSGLILTAGFVSGCGGGGSSPGSVSTGAPGVTQSFGSLTARVVGNLSVPVTVSGSGAVVTGVAGASITSLANVPANTLSNTLIAFDRNGNVMGVSPSGSGLYNITTDLVTYSNATHPSWNYGATALTYQRYDPSASIFQIYTARSDGSSPIKLSTGGFNDTTPAYSQDSRHIAFVRSTSGFNQIWVMNGNGSLPVKVSDGTANDINPSWSADSSRIAFSRYIGGHYQVYVMSATGGSPHAVTSSLTGYDMYAPAFSRDGTKIAFSMAVGTASYIYAVRADGATFQQITSAPSGVTYNDYNPTFSPDNKQIAFSRSTGSGPTSIWTASAVDGSAAMQITAGSTGFGDATPSWSSYPASLTLIGSAGALATSAGGFLYSQQGTTIPSVLAFDSPTRSGLTVTSQSGASTGSPNVVFSITSTNNITSLVYRNGLSTPTVNAILASNPAMSAIVSYDASTGLVASVLPYNTSAVVSGAVGAHAAIKPTVQGNVLTYQAHFLSAWDGSGKNHAPGGASVVKIDGRTGALISVS